MSGISVVIPCYNRATLIRETLLSLLNQTVAAAEIIIVDDGSTDGTAEIAETVFRGWRDSRTRFLTAPEFKVIRQENAGLGPARNTGLREARGEFIHFFDSDDIAMSSKHEVQLAKLAQEDADIVLSPWVSFSKTSDQISLDNFVLQSELPDDKHTLIQWWLRGWSVLLQTMLIRADLLKSLGYLGSDMPTHEDEAYFSRILAARPRIAHAEGIQVLYRIHDSGNLTTRGTGPVLGRTIDRANYLLSKGKIFMHELLGMERLIHAMNLHKCLQDFRLLNQAEHPVARNVCSALRPFPAWILHGTSIWDRIATRIRFQTHGTRWPGSVRPRPISRVERQRCMQTLQGQLPRIS